MTTPPDMSPSLDARPNAFPSPEAIMAERLALLRARFIERTSMDAERLQMLVDQRRSNPAPAAENDRLLTMLAHSLSGSAGIFGFPEISAASALLEARLRDPDRRDAAIDVAIDGLQLCLTRMLL